MGYIAGGYQVMLLLPFTFLLFGLLADANKRRICGTFIDESKIEDMERMFGDLRLEAKTSAGYTQTIYIDLHFHVIYENTTLEGGHIPDQQIKDQIDVLNTDYGLTGLRWRHVNTTRTQNPEWFVQVGPDSEPEKNMKSILKAGEASALNVYSVGFRSGVGEGLLGYSTFPWDYSSKSTLDGVVILYSSLPGGTLAPYNKGRTLTHEIGHWLGLYHTFQGGCRGQGDFVSDTPAELSPAYGCPNKRDSCPNDPGFDPIHNFMDYSDDVCMREFTAGQISRLRSQISVYRGLRE
ncbi:metalloprotease [Macrolepiota fuliginosa MF-IS2]|uniref:Metalloprotease n=1 Tax=Macrolepiota fuliginosa MF-IS2 TaxID=1400762 RepID=A0A9P5XL89_9AGAR|nr:metalloprotease [Macrolepiota fuliginosa MF-IS2]